MTVSTAIILIPLASIANQQVAKLKDTGIPAIYVNNKKCMQEVLKSHYSHIFISPELVEHSLIRSDKDLHTYSLTRVTVL